jgi:hypothetical protein
MHMTRRFIVVFFGLTLLAPFMALGDHVPIPPDNNIDYELDFRVFYKTEKFTPMFALKGRWEYEDNLFYYRSLTLGAYYRLTRHLKIGGFYRLQQGARHDDDWIFTDPGWAWQDTRDRTEHVLIADATPRFLMPFIPGRNWVFMFKTRYLYNTYNAQQTLKLRPGVTYFLMPNREPLLNFTFNYELYLALNYSSSLLYEQWPYLEVMYHLSKTVKLGARAAYRITNWSTSEDVIQQGDSPYEVKYRAFVLGAFLNLQFGR